MYNEMISKIKVTEELNRVMVGGGNELLNQYHRQNQIPGIINKVYENAPLMKIDLIDLESAGLTISDFSVVNVDFTDVTIKGRTIDLSDVKNPSNVICLSVYEGGAVAFDFMTLDEVDTIQSDHERRYLFLVLGILEFTDEPLMRHIIGSGHTLISGYDFLLDKDRLFRFKHVITEGLRDGDSMLLEVSVFNRTDMPSSLITRFDYHAETGGFTNNDLNFLNLIKMIRNDKSDNIVPIDYMWRAATNYTDHYRRSMSVDDVYVIARSGNDLKFIDQYGLDQMLNLPLVASTNNYFHYVCNIDALFDTTNRLELTNSTTYSLNDINEYRMNDIKNIEDVESLLSYAPTVFGPGVYFEEEGHHNSLCGMRLALDNPAGDFIFTLNGRFALNEKNISGSFLGQPIVSFIDSEDQYATAQYDDEQDNFLGMGTYNSLVLVRRGTVLTMYMEDSNIEFKVPEFIKSLNVDFSDLIVHSMNMIEDPTDVDVNLTDYTIEKFSNLVNDKSLIPVFPKSDIGSYQFLYTFSIKKNGDGIIKAISDPMNLIRGIIAIDDTMYIDTNTIRFMEPVTKEFNYTVIKSNLDDGGVVVIGVKFIPTEGFDFELIKPLGFFTRNNVLIDGVSKPDYISVTNRTRCVSVNTDFSYIDISLVKELHMDLIELMTARIPSSFGEMLPFTRVIDKTIIFRHELYMNDANLPLAPFIANMYLLFEELCGKNYIKNDLEMEDGRLPIEVIDSSAGGINLGKYRFEHDLFRLDIKGIKTLSDINGLPVDVMFAEMVTIYGDTLKTQLKIPMSTSWIHMDEESQRITIANV